MRTEISAYHASCLPSRLLNKSDCIDIYIIIEIKSVLNLRVLKINLSFFLAFRENPRLIHRTP